MRVLSRSEALVVQLLLARSRSRGVGVRGIETPHRRTVQSIRQRAYERGWLRDRYLPAPGAFGLDRITFALALPPVDRLPEITDRWRARPENVLLWSSDTGLFGVFWSSSSERGELGGMLREDSGRGAGSVLEVGGDRPSLPVYFDFEMAWVRATGLSGVSEACPRSVPIPRSSGDAPDAPSPANRRWVLDWIAEQERYDLRRLEGAPFWSSRRAEGCLAKGWLGFRTLLDPAAVAASASGFPDWSAFVRGQLNPGAHPPDLYRALVETAGVSPYLFVSDGPQVLFATLSVGPGVRWTVAPTAVLPTVQKYLHDIAVDQWPLGSRRVVTDHEYSRCLAHSLPALGSGEKHPSIPTGSTSTR